MITRSFLAVIVLTVVQLEASSQSCDSRLRFSMLTSSLSTNSSFGAQVSNQVSPLLGSMAAPVVAADNHHAQEHFDRLLTCTYRHAMDRVSPQNSLVSTPKKFKKKRISSQENIFEGYLAQSVRSRSKYL